MLEEKLSGTTKTKSYLFSFKFRRSLTLLPKNNLLIFLSSLSTNS